MQDLWSRDFRMGKTGRLLKEERRNVLPRHLDVGLPLPNYIWNGWEKVTRRL